jgi:hypothetical protein
MSRAAIKRSMRRSFCSSKAICLRRDRICFSAFGIVSLLEILGAEPILALRFLPDVPLAMIHSLGAGVHSRV